MRARPGAGAPVAVAALIALLVGCASEGAARAHVEGGDAGRAPAAIATYGCGSCHTIPGIRGADATVAPPLVDIGDRGVIAGKVPFTTDALVAWIEHPQALDPGVAMPEMGVTEQDARDIAEYLLNESG